MHVFMCMHIYIYIYNVYIYIYIYRERERHINMTPGHSVDTKEFREKEPTPCRHRPLLV